MPLAENINCLQDKEWVSNNRGHFRVPKTPEMRTLRHLGHYNLTQWCSRLEVVLLSLYIEGHKLMDLQTKQRMNLEQQRFTSQEAEHIQLDMMGREIEARVQVCMIDKAYRL